MRGEHRLIAPVALLALARRRRRTLTPEGPATLYDDWHGGQTLEGVPGAAHRLPRHRPARRQAGRSACSLSHEGTVHAAAPVHPPGRARHLRLPRTARAARLPRHLARDRAGDRRPAIAAPDPLRARGRRGRHLQLAVAWTSTARRSARRRPDRRPAEVQRGRTLTIERVTEPDADGDQRRRPHRGPNQPADDR